MVDEAYVDYARRQLFSHDKRTIDKMLFIQGALLQHANRAVHQTVYACRQARETEQIKHTQMFLSDAGS